MKTTKIKHGMDRRTFLAEMLIGSVLVLDNVKLRASAGVPNVVPLPNGRWAASVLRADHPNSNKHIYSKEVLERAVKEFRNHTVGQFGMPGVGSESAGWIGSQSSIVRFKDMSHIVYDLRLEEDYLVAEIVPMNTSQGKVLMDLLTTRPELVAFRTAGIGYGEMRDDGYLVIAEPNFRLTGIHALLANKAAAL